MDVQSFFPSVVPMNLERTHYKGFIEVKSVGGSSREFMIEIWLKNPDSMKEARIDCEWKLQQLLSSQKTLVKDRLEQSENIVSFLKELTKIVECQLENSQSEVNLVKFPQFYSELLKEIEALGWDRLSYINSTFTELYFLIKDSQQRHHKLKVELHNQHPVKAPRYFSDLPIAFDYKWMKQSQLSGLLSYFEETVGGFQDFWNVLDELDGNCVILEPDQPSRAATRRRIALGNAASLQITVNPSQPRLVPDCKFLGSEQVVGPLKENFNKNIENWDCEGSLYDNLQSTLQINFPSASTSTREEMISDCAICYSYRLMGDIPDQACENNQCAQVFHRTCLSEWLRSLPSSRLSFNVLFGECPFCKKDPFLEFGDLERNTLLINNNNNRSIVICSRLRGPSRLRQLLDDIFDSFVKRSQTDEKNTVFNSKCKLLC